MKKILCLLSAVLFAFTSCSKDDDDSLDGILVKKIIEFKDGNPINRTIQYHGNKFMSITEEDGSKTKFTYTGNQITKIERFNESGMLEKTEEYGYTNGLLTNLVEKYDDDYSYKTKYVHNNDGTVAYEKFKVTISTGIEEKYEQAGKLTFRNGNLIEDENFPVVDGNFTLYGSVVKYEYDNKNFCFKNIIGINLLLNDSPSVNNILKETHISGSVENPYTSITTYTYTYDVNGYPTEKIAAFPNGNSVSLETTQYEY